MDHYAAVLHAMNKCMLGESEWDVLELTPREFNILATSTLNLQWFNTVDNLVRDKGELIFWGVTIRRVYQPVSSRIRYEYLKIVDSTPWMFLLLDKIEK